MRMRFLRDYKWAEHGIHVHGFARGQEYDLTEEAVRAALRDGAAELVGVPKPVVSAATEPAQPGKPGAPEASGQETPAASLPPAPASRQTRRNMPKAKPKS